MAILSLEGMHFNAPHGYYPEEGLTGNAFTLDVWVDFRLSQPEHDHDNEDDVPVNSLGQTLNYETLYQLCQVEMRQPTELIETLAQRIMDRLLDFFSELRGVRVRLHKHHPPLGGRVDKAVIELSQGTFDLPSLRSLVMLRSLSENMDELNPVQWNFGKEAADWFED